MEWKPIKTAPRDGTIIILAQRGEVFPGWYWACPETEYCWWFIDESEVELSDESGDVVRPNAWCDDKYAPTHWMPLPAPPANDK